MERESFESEAVAKVLNSKFVSIKVNEYPFKFHSLIGTYDQYYGIGRVAQANPTMHETQ